MFVLWLGAAASWTFGARLALQHLTERTIPARLCGQLSQLTSG